MPSHFNSSCAALSLSRKTPLFTRHRCRALKYLDVGEEGRRGKEYISEDFSLSEMVQHTQ